MDTTVLHIIGKSSVPSLRTATSLSPGMTTPQVREALKGAGTPISATDAIAAADHVGAAATA